MTGPESHPRDPARDTDASDDVSIVPGLGPVGPTGAPTGPLDMSKDPDRYDPDRESTPEPAYDPAAIGGPLDMSLDPDRFHPPGQGQTLTDLLGEGAHEDKRDNAQWAWGLISIVGFLLLVSFLFGTVLSPR